MTMTQSVKQELFTSYLAPILNTAYGTALYITSDRAEADCLVQEASMRAYTEFSDFRSAAGFKSGFLRRVIDLFRARHRTLRLPHPGSGPRRWDGGTPSPSQDAPPPCSACRGYPAASPSSSALRTVPGVGGGPPEPVSTVAGPDGAGDPLGDDLAGNPFDPPEPFLRALSEQQIVEGFSRLPVEDRIVCALYFMDDLSYAEIADVVGCPVTTVRARLRRGRTALSRTLRAAAPPSGRFPGPCGMHGTLSL
jgi:RNA polymerase sigma-70 factor, ECF subfamily